MTRFVHYLTPKNQHHGLAVVRGFPAETVPTQPALLGLGYTHIVGGLLHGQKDVLLDVRKSGEPWVFWDRAYFGGGSDTNRIRLTLGAYQKHWISEPRWRDRELNRLARWGVELKPWRNDGDFIMVVPPTDLLAQLFGIRWDAYLQRIRAATKRPIIVSPKEDRNKSPITERLRGCHCVICYTSNVAVDAIAEGIPAVVSRYAAAAPVAGDIEALSLEDEIENPKRVDDWTRTAWAQSLSWGQFTLDEVESGFAREIVMEQAPR